MPIGITSFAYRWAIRWGRMNLFDLIARAGEAGAEVVQICDNTPLAAEADGTLEELARRAKELGIALEVGIKGVRLEQLHHAHRIARILGARILRVSVSPSEESPLVDTLARNIGALLPDLRGSGVAVAIENHTQLVPRDIVRVIQRLNDPRVGACLDPVNSINRLIGSAEAVSALAPYAVSVHIKDALPVSLNTGFYIQGCPLGEGFVDVAHICDAARADGRSPNFLVEAWMDRSDDEASTLAREESWIRHGIEYLRRFLP